MATTHYFLSLWISLLTQHKSTNIYLFVLCIDRCFDFTFIYLVCVVCRWWWWVWRSEVNLQDQGLSPTLWILGIELQSSDFGGNHFYLQSHFSSPFFFFEIGIFWTYMWEVGVRPVTWMLRPEDSFIVSSVSSLLPLCRFPEWNSGIRLTMASVLPIKNHSCWDIFPALRPDLETSGLHLQRMPITGIQHHDQQIVFWSIKLDPFYKVWLMTLVTLLIFSFLLPFLLFLFPLLFLFSVFVFLFR